MGHPCGQVLVGLYIQSVGDGISLHRGTSVHRFTRRHRQPSGHHLHDEPPPPKDPTRAEDYLRSTNNNVILMEYIVI